MTTVNSNKGTDSSTLSLSDMESDLAKTFHPAQGQVLGRLAKNEDGGRMPGKGYIDRDRSKKTASVLVICLGAPIRSATVDLARATIDLSPDELEVEPGNVVVVAQGILSPAPGRLEKAGLVLFSRNGITALRDDLIREQFNYAEDSKIKDAIGLDREKAEKEAKSQKEKEDKKAVNKKDEPKKEPTKDQTELQKRAEEEAAAAKKLQDEQNRKEAEAKALHEKAEKERAEAERRAREAEERELQAKAADAAARQAEAAKLRAEQEAAQKRLDEAKAAQQEKVAKWEDADVDAMLQAGPEGYMPLPDKRPAKVSDKVWGQWRKATREGAAAK